MGSALRPEAPRRDLRPDRPLIPHGVPIVPELAAERKGRGARPTGGSA